VKLVNRDSLHYAGEMFPIRDHNPSSRTPYVTYLLIGANVLVYLLNIPGISSDATMIYLYQNWALFPVDITSGGSPVPLVSSMFLHANFWHIAGNMLFLWVFGDNMEDAFGHIGFLLFYLAAGVGAGLAHVMFQPFSDIPTIGASGAIAGVLGGYLLLYPKARVDVIFFFIVFFKIIPIPAWITLGGWFALQLFNGALDDGSGGGVAYWAHVGGFASGLILTLPIWLRRGRGGTGVPTGAARPTLVEDRFSTSDVPTVRRRR
jgi:rhomboid family protein